MAKKKEPGDLGRLSKGVAVEMDVLIEYSQLAREGVIKLSWADFVNEAIKNELARYREQTRRSKRQ